MHNHKAKLLIVDDETDLVAELQPMLERSGYAVITATNGMDALARIAHDAPDLVVLDVLMPRMDGRDVVRRLRQQDNWTPVILLTQVNTAPERVLSPQEGADDYINKPFEPLELLARIEAVLRRTNRNAVSATAVSAAHARRLRSGELLLDRTARRVILAGREVNLTMRAFDLLAHLMRNAGDSIARDRLLDEVWGWRYSVSTRAVDIRIAEIRKVLGDDPSQPRYIETVTGHGYRFIPTVQAEA